MSKSVLLVGGSGFIGSRLALCLRSLNYKVGVVTRNQPNDRDFPNIDEVISWDNLQRISTYDAIVNLAGANIGGHRWTEEYKRAILNSRISATKKIVDAINKYQNNTSVFLSVSAIGYYGDRGNETLDESSLRGEGFLSDVCADWEAESQKASNIRVVNPRFGIVLDSKEGALSKLLTPIKFFVGGALGSGKQWMSWIHIEDLVSSVVKIIEHDKIEGAVNIVSPNPVVNSEFVKVCGTVLKRPTFFSVPEFILKRVLGERSAIILDSQKVLPLKLQKMNFDYKYNNLLSAMNDLL